MPRVNIPVTTITRAGVAEPAQVTADATNDHYISATDFANGDLEIEIESTDAAPQTVEIVANPDLNVDGLTVSNLTVSIPAGAIRRVAQLRYRSFRQPSDQNRMHLNPSVSTTLKFRAYRVPTA
jgi:hypothetical protein